MFDGNVESIVDEEHLLQPETLFHVFDFADHFFYGTDDPPASRLGGLRRVACGVGEIAQLGQDTDTEPRSAVFRHVEVLKSGGLGEFGVTAHTVIHDLAALAPHQTGQVIVGRLANLQAVG